jgi:hypothetical protein
MFPKVTGVRFPYLIYVFISLVSSYRDYKSVFGIIRILEKWDWVV